MLDEDEETKDFPLFSRWSEFTDHSVRTGNERSKKNLSGYDERTCIYAIIIPDMCCLRSQIPFESTSLEGRSSFECGT